MNADLWSRVGEVFHRLADLPPAEQERELSRLAAEDPDVAAEVRSLLAGDVRAAAMPERAALDHREAAGIDGSKVPEALAPGAIVGPYRILGELARGGMGVVYRAERADGAFERRVAIKVVRPDLLAPILGERFLAERRILATLDHPGIVRLLDAGTSGDGRLYLVLDLVEGETLGPWAANRTLREKLDLFLGITDAVEHAHRRLVLHRDLKPGNVLVTAEGSPRLLDFGIARLLGPDGGEAATRFGARALTPDYASPEQLRGEPLGTPSDVYSLGVMLFELVAGVRPYDAKTTTSPEELARRIETGDRPRASSAARRGGRRVPASRAFERDLDAIVARALEPGIAERYPGVAELAADLRNLLAGRAVSARPASLRERGARFVRRHRAPVATAAAVTLVLLAATFFSVRQARIAERQRALAEQRFDEVRKLARVFLFELPQRIEALPGSTEARTLLVRTGLDYLDRLAASAPPSAELAAELATGFERLGEVEAGFHSANAGDTQRAIAAFDRAVELRLQHFDASTAAAASRRDLANARLLRASALFKLGRMEESLREAGAASELATAALAAAPAGESSVSYQGVLARALSLHGFVDGALGELQRGEATLRRSLEIFDRLAADPVVAEAIHLDRSRALERLGSIIGQDVARLDEVEKFWGEALAFDRERLARNPRDPRSRRAVVGDLGRIAILRGIQGRIDEALEASGEAVRFAEELAAEDPRNFEALRGLAQLQNRRSTDLLENGRLVEAGDSARAGLASVTALLERDPSNVTVETLVAEGHLALGEVLVAQARRERRRALWLEARRELSSGVAIIAALVERGVLSEKLGEAKEADRARELLGECERALAAADGAS